MLNTERILETLGGTQALKRTIGSWEDLHKLILGGLPISTYTHLLRAFSLTAHEAADIFHIPTRTLARRMKARRLAPDESDRVFRFARIATRASEVLGSEEKAQLWLHRPNRALGNILPLNLLATDAGVEQVETVLGRLEHGVYS
jgi:putative toxin-antitoxin system antitoxin component (TIGR02293 family)